MSDLVVVAYPDINRAAEVLQTLAKLQTERLIDLEDACYATKGLDGKAELHQSLNLPAIGAVSGGASGAMWGTFVGLLFLAPLAGLVIGAASGAASGALSGKLTDIGINDDLMKKLSASLIPGSSAIFVLVRSVTADKVVPEVAKYGGTVLQTSLANDAEQRLQSALAGEA